MYGYDALYRLTDVTYPNESTETYEYDAAGNRTVKKVDGVVTKQCGYNEANQLKTRQTSGSGTPTLRRGLDKSSPYKLYFTARGVIQNYFTPSDPIRSR
jgi:YD repeat-containing protein